MTYPKSPVEFDDCTYNFTVKGTNKRVAVVFTKAGTSWKAEVYYSGLPVKRHNLVGKIGAKQIEAQKLARAFYREYKKEIDSDREQP